MERNLSDDVVLSNLRTMQDPTELLKFSYTGKPKFRVFQLDPSLSYLYWESKKKSSDQTKSMCPCLLSLSLSFSLSFVSPLLSFFSPLFLSLFPPLSLHVGLSILVFFLCSRHVYLPSPSLPLYLPTPLLPPVRLSEIHEIRFGQRTAKFDRNNRQDLSGLSFSIIYGMSLLHVARALSPASLLLSLITTPPPPPPPPLSLYLSISFVYLTPYLNLCLSITISSLPLSLPLPLLSLHLLSQQVSPER